MNDITDNKSKRLSLGENISIAFIDNFVISLISFPILMIIWELGTPLCSEYFGIDGLENIFVCVPIFLLASLITIIITIFSYYLLLDMFGRNTIGEYLLKININDEGKNNRILRGLISSILLIPLFIIIFINIYGVIYYIFFFSLN
jgi:hypothetical protein